MTPEEAVALLKNPQVIQQLIDLTRDPGIVKRLTEIASGQTVSQQGVELLRNPDIARELTSLVQRTEVYHQLLGALSAAAVWVAVPIAISAVTLVLVLYNTVLLRRMERERDRR
jgi:hypothetical protein